MFVASDLTRALQTFQVISLTNANSVLTAFDAMTDGSMIALGFSNGTLLLYEGDFLKGILMCTHTNICINSYISKSIYTYKLGHLPACVPSEGVYKSVQSKILLKEHKSLCAGLHFCESGASKV